MTTQALSQLNIRLDASLKSAGDRALLQEGISPTELIRALWKKITRSAADLRQVEQVLELVEEAPSEAVRQDKVLLMQEGRKFVAEGLASLGGNFQTVSREEKSDRELYVDALYDRMRERGTL